MKLYMIFVLLVFVPLAFAGRPFRRPTRVAKVLWDSDHIIQQGYDISALQFEYRNDQLSFVVRKYMREGSQKVVITEENLKEQNLSFAIDLFAFPSFAGESGLCVRNSSDSLKHLIVECSSLAVFREMNPEEKDQMEKYKENQKVTNQLFKIVFDEVKLWRSQSFGLSSFEAQGYQRETGYNNYTNALVVNTVEHDYRNYNPYKFTNMRLLNNSITTSSFVIENKPFPKKDDCYLVAKQIKLKGLRPTDCFGNVTIRAKTDEDDKLWLA